MSEWKEYNLGQLYNVTSGLSKAANQFGFGNVFISFKDVFWNFFLPDSPVELVNSNEKEQRSCSVKKGDILLTRTSESLEEVGMSSVALRDYNKSTFNGFCKRLRIRDDAPIRVSPLYIGYLLRTRFFRKSVANFATMTTRASLNSESIKSIPLPFPDFTIQEEIGITLYNLDSKIDLLKQQNHTLEELAQTLFNRWFVEFEFPNKDGEPYKSSGGRMVESELGEIPEGWGVGQFQDVASVKGRIGWRGYTHEDLVADGPLVIGGRDINGMFISLDKVQHITRSKYDESPEIQLEDLDIILSKTGTIGPAALFDKTLLGEATINPNVALVRANKGLAEFTYTLLKLPSTQHYLNSHTTSSVQPAVNQENIRIMPLALPRYEVLVKVSKAFIPLYKKMIHNNREIQNLTQLRDTLLPKLMSGELRVTIN